MRDKGTFTITFDEQTLPVIEQISEGLPGGFFIYHADGDQELIHINGTMLRIFGCDTLEEFKELTGYTFKGIVHPADIDKVEESICTQIGRGGDNLDYVEYRIVRKDGTVRWVEDYGHFVQTQAYGDLFYVFIEDATERIQKRVAELERVNEALYGAHLREDYFKKALLYDAVSFVEINLTRDEFISASVLNEEGEVQNLFAFMGMQPFEKYSDFTAFWADFTETGELDEYHRFFNIERLIRCYEEGEREQTYDSWVTDMYGRKRLSHYIFFLEKNEHTGEVTALSVSKDITEQVERQSLLKSALRQAEAERLTRNTFFANMSHDIRTPLNAIIGYAELLKGCVGDPGKVGECIEKINRSGEELLAVCYPIWNTEFTSIARVIGEPTEYDSIQGYDKTMGYLYFTRRSCCVAFYELMQTRPAWEGTVIGKAAVMNAIWRYLPKYAAMAPGLSENSWKNYLSKIETERERVIRMSPEAGDDFLLFLKEQ